MEYNKAEFAHFLKENNVIKFGNFILKSGKKSKYFLNFGDISSGSALLLLGKFYAQKIKEEIGFDSFDVILGPSYKGIPLALATSIAISELFSVNKPFVFDRKEAKTHGEGSNENVSKLFVGHKLNGNERLLMLDDVLTTGGTKLELMDKMNSLFNGLSFPAIIIAVDRKEKDEQGLTALEKFEKDTNIKVISITDIFDICAACEISQEQLLSS
ncbi:MAG: orotate phosphoribosyltransferase [Pseudomonadota bacterium]